jgi:hypothetical protein
VEEGHGMVLLVEEQAVCMKTTDMVGFVEVSTAVYTIPDCTGTTSCIT